MNIQALGKIIGNIDIAKCSDTIADIAQEGTDTIQKYATSALDALHYKGNQNIIKKAPPSLEDLMSLFKERYVKNLDNRGYHYHLEKYYEPSTLLRKGNGAYCFNAVLNCRTGAGCPLEFKKLEKVMSVLVDQRNDEYAQKLMVDLLSWKAPIDTPQSGADILIRISESPQKKLLIESMLKLEEILTDKKMDRDEIIQTIGNTIDYVSDLEKVNFSFIKKVAKLYASPNKYSQELTQLADLKMGSTLYEMDDAITDMINKQYF